VGPTSENNTHLQELPHSPFCILQIFVTSSRTTNCHCRAAGVAGREPRVREHPLHQHPGARRVQPPALRPPTRFLKDSFTRSLQLYGDPPHHAAVGSSSRPPAPAQAVPSRSRCRPPRSTISLWPSLASSWAPWWLGCSSSLSACSTRCTADVEPHATRHKKDSIDGFGEEREYGGKGAPIPSPFFPRSNSMTARDAT
jgi:hypothetical protein